MGVKTMSDREQAKVYIIEVAKRLYDTESNIKKDFKQYFLKTTVYNPRFLSDGEYNGTSVKRSELFQTNDDNKYIIKILKLAYSMVQSHSYDSLILEKDCIKLSAIQVGKGEFSISIRLIDLGKNLQIIVNTVSNR